MTDEFYRIQRLPPYVFAEVHAMKAAARARGEDIVDLGMGNPDGKPPQHVIDKLCEVANKPNAHRYSASKGIPGLRKAQAAYYQRRFAVELDADREVIVTLGSKEGLANLAQAITAPGDVVLADGMIANLRPGAIRDLDSDHDPMLSHPKDLASLINEIAAERKERP